jgi:HlyD family secretion protein
MDRVIAPEYQQQKRRNTFLIAGLIAAVILASLYFFRNVLKTSVEASKIRIATADAGIVENTLDATGEVIPAFEQTITSPIRATLVKVLLSPGTWVEAGQAILDLDKSLTLIELDKMKDQLDLKRNSIDQLRMKLNKNLYDAEISDKIKSLNINRLRAEVEDTRRLLKVGGRTQEDVTRAENALRIAELEKKQLENDLFYNRQSMGASLRESELGAQIEEKNLREMEHKIRMADIKADRPGVITWVNEYIGSAVSEGEALVKIADLASFRVDGSCSDVYAGQLKEGLPVIVKVNDTIIRGSIARVKPAVKNSVVQFVIGLDNKSHASLRPNLKVEVYVVTSRSGRTVRVPNGPAFKGKRQQVLYVVDGNVARRREVETGLTNFDFVEIKRGLQPGEKIILTDLSEYQHLEEITIEQ